MNFLKAILLSSFLLALSPICYSADSAALNKQRTIFQQAKKALQTNQTTQFAKLNKQLENYPLQPYLDYLYLQHRLNHVSSDTISNFIKKNQNTFYADRLRKSWLNRLATTKKWALFLENYQEPQSTSRQCLRLQALIATGDTEQAFAEIPALWSISRSQNKACDPAFALWKKEGHLTDDLRWQRIQLALRDNQFNLAKYLAKSLDNAKEANQWIQRWQKMHSNPLSLLKQLPDEPPLNQKVSLTHDVAISREIIKHGLYRLAKKSTDKAFEAWQRIESSYSFSVQDKLTIQRSIANRAALNREDRTLEFFGDIPAETWRVRAALWQQDWQAVYDAVLSLNSNDQQSSRWKYWLARSQAQLGDQQTANKTYQTLTLDRDFYSFLAADQLQQPYQMNHNPIQFTADELATFSQRPAVLRLNEFYALNMGLESRRQAYALKLKLSKKELQLLATLTHQWGWHNQTISLLGKAKYWDALDLRFPVVYNETIIKESKVNDLDPSWLLGIARQESAFNPHARSHVGASGLMQLMPKTATLIARLIKKPLKRQSELLNPDRNIQLGSAYLRKMYDEKQQNPVLATASYNAGPHRISRWLPKKDMAADIWIENIPYKETRRYTRSVLSYTAIFDHQRKQAIIPLSQRMPTVKAKTP